MKNVFTPSANPARISGDTEAFIKAIVKTDKGFPDYYAYTVGNSYEESNDRAKALCNALNYFYNSDGKNVVAHGPAKVGASNRMEEMNQLLNEITEELNQIFSNEAVMTAIRLLGKEERMLPIFKKLHRLKLIFD